MDENGQALNKILTKSDYARFFTAYDIFQGWLGNCFHIGAIMALTKNEQLLEIVIPPDNALRQNMKSGAYHFRFWKLGFWYDVVVDDFLPVKCSTNDLIFSHNEIYPNEFWAPLFEKAFAKFMGNYDELEGGLFENSALYLSGGLHEQYMTNISIKHTKNIGGSVDDSTSLDGDDDLSQHPNAEELFEIISFALKKADMVGCILEDVCEHLSSCK